jgi:hypothetical protein
MLMLSLQQWKVGKTFGVSVEGVRGKYHQRLIVFISIAAADFEASPDGGSRAPDRQESPAGRLAYV